MANTTISQIQFENDGQLLDIKPLVDYIYPVGAIYISTTLVDPAVLFGGEWNQIQGKFLLSANETYEAGTSGGSATMDHTHTMAHTHQQVAVTSGGPSNNTSGSTGLSVAQMPSHNHNSRSLSGDIIMHAGEEGNFIAGVSGIVSAWDGKPNQYRTAHDVVLRSGARSYGHMRINATHTHDSQGSGSGHTHTLSSHTHSIAATTTGAASNATTSAASNDNNMPPYLAVYMWERVA